MTALMNEASSIRNFNRLGLSRLVHPDDIPIWPPLQWKVKRRILIADESIKLNYTKHEAFLKKLDVKRR